MFDRWGGEGGEGGEKGGGVGIIVIVPPHALRSHSHARWNLVLKTGNICIQQLVVI